jgi:hypothetical protein
LANDGRVVVVGAGLAVGENVGVPVDREGIPLEVVVVTPGRGLCCAVGRYTVRVPRPESKRSETPVTGRVPTVCWSLTGRMAVCVAVATCVTGKP